MPKKTTRKSRARGGFTFSEVLVTLAILGALLAVAIPATFALTKGLKMMELDACARQVAVAVQNNLTGMKSAGTLKSYGTGTTGGHYISNGDADVQKILPIGAIDPAVADKYYTIVYNSATGTVLEVYYAEDPFNVSDALTNLSGMGTAEVEARKAAKIGYYNGDDIKSGPASTLPKPVITVENGLELQVTVTTKSMDWFDKATLTLHVAKEDGTGEVKFEMPRFQMVSTQILDSLANDSERRFDYIINGIALKKKIAPGDNLKIWATLDPKEPSKYLSKTSNIAYTNSLFGTYDTVKNEVTIENARHLQNLDKIYSNFKITNNITALQTADITWQAVQNFIPIHNDQLTSYNGGTKPINGLKVAVDTPAGLFERFSGQTLTGIRLVDPSIIGTGGEAAGALVGTAENVTVKDCFAYASVPLQLALEVKVSGTIAGGLIGSATNCNISYSGAAMPTVTGATTAGGLIGEATTTTVTNSYADTDNLRVAHKDAYVAGFIGSAEGTNVKVENCYAVGNCYAVDDNGEKVNKVCGFISGYKNQSVAVNVKNSYCAMTYLDAAGKPIGLENIGGFSRLYGTDNNGAYTNCAYLTPVGATVSPDLPDSKVPPISYADLAARATENTIWTKYPMSHPYRDDLKDKTYPFPALKRADGIAKMPHYGSWPAVPAPKGEVFLAYYEKYEGGSTGIYYLDKDGKVVNTLAGNDKIISSTGYGLALPKDSTIITDVTVNILVEGEEENIENEMNDPKVEPILIDNVNFYPFENDMLDEFNSKFMDAMKESQTFSAKIIIGVNGAAKEDDKTYQINPNFAAGIAPADKPLGTKDWPLQVRTQEQLQAVNSITVTGNHDCYFLQTHNIPMNGSWSPINFSENYDGNQQVISGLLKPLFATIQSGSTVQNVVIERAQVTANHGDGIFASVNSGTITSCNVRNSKIEFNGGWNKFIAGFVGTNNGTIQNSHVHPDKDKKPSTISAKNGDAYGFVGTNSGTITLCSAVANVTSTKGNAAGFVGQNSGTIQKSYANCTVQGGARASGFVNVNQGTIKGCYAMGSAAADYGTAAGFIIQSDWRKGDVKNCYAAVIMSGASVYGFGIGGSWEFDTCYYYVPNGASVSNYSGAQRVTSYANATGNSLLNNLIRASGSSVWTGTGPAYPFNPALNNPNPDLPTTIPFPSISSNEHYGDWPTRSLSDGNFMGVFYYEKQKDGTYFIDAVGLSCTFDRYGQDTKLLDNNPALHIVKGDFANINRTSKEKDNGLGIFWPNNTDDLRNYGPQGCSYIVYDKRTNGDFEENKQCKNQAPAKRIDFADGYTSFSHLDPTNDRGWTWGDTPNIVLRSQYNGKENWKYQFEYNIEKRTWTIK